MNTEPDPRRASDNDSADDHDYHHHAKKFLFPDPQHHPIFNVPPGLEVLHNATALHVTTYPTHDPGEVHKYAVSDDTGTQILLIEEIRRRRTLASQTRVEDNQFLVLNFRGRTVLTMELKVSKGFCRQNYELTVQLRSTDEPLGTVKVKNHIFPGVIWDGDGQKRMTIGASHIGISRVPCIGICIPTKGANARARQTVYLQDYITKAITNQFLIEDTPGIHVGIKLPDTIEPELKAVLLTYLVHYHIWLTHHQEQHHTLLPDEHRAEDYLPYLTLDALASDKSLTKGSVIATSSGRLNA